jgi:hypothetical protein
MSSMNSLRTALQLYRADQGAYPPVLLGYVNAYSGSISNITPANLLVGPLYPKLANSISTFQPSLDRSTFGAANINLATSQANWPAKLNSLQRYGPTDGYVLGCYGEQGNPDNPLPNYYYMISGYDVAQVPQAATGTNQVELHYTLFWSNLAVPADPCNPDVHGSSADTPRQLGYSDPPETTVVTWDSFFRDPIQNGTIPNNKGDIVLFLGGSARPYPSQVIGSQSWQAMP